MSRASQSRVIQTTALPLLLILAFSLPVVAQEDPGLFFDTVDVYVVNVEVVVTDKEGNPATGLTREDFEIFEDGKPVELSNFFAVEGRQGVIAGVAQEAAPAPKTKRLNLVVFIDNLNMRPEGRNAIFKDLRSYLADNLDPRDRVMLVAMGDSVEVAQNFTIDQELLSGTLDRLGKQTGAHLRFETQRSMTMRRLQRATLPSNPGDAGDLAGAAMRNFEAAQDEARNLSTDFINLAEMRLQMVRASVQAIGRFTESLAGMPGRKAVLYVSDGLPERPAESMGQAWLNKFSDWIVGQNARGLNSVQMEMSRLVGSSRYSAKHQLDELAQVASANGVAFYPISGGGSLTRSGGAVSAERIGAATTSGGGAYSQDVIALESQSLESSLLRLAEKTGGIAFTRSTNITGLLERMVHDFDSFYSLGYSPPHATDDEFHEIEVKVKRPDLTVRHFGGYREKDPVANLQDLTLSALHYDLEDNQLEVRLEAGEQVPGKGERYVVSVQVKIPFQKLLLIPQEEFHSAQVSLFVIVREEKSGNVSPFRRIDLPVKIPNAQILQALTQAATYPLQLEMKRGRQRISIGVRDHLADVDSTVNLDLNVGGEVRAAASAAPSRR